MPSGPECLTETEVTPSSRVSNATIPALAFAPFRFSPGWFRSFGRASDAVTFTSQSGPSPHRGKTSRLPGDSELRLDSSHPRGPEDGPD